MKYVYRYVDNEKQHNWVVQHADYSVPGKIAKWMECSKCNAAIVYEFRSREIIGIEPEGTDPIECDVIGYVRKNELE
ncbi:MAG: hypothetical protein OXL96_24700 [Candidatus Poribacteria bacterium]|nr:hypothetical protein [Candidatus Poribacteria bacterium]